LASWCTRILSGLR